MSDFFNLKRGCRQGGPISSYVFILCAEILGKMIRDNKVLKDIRINGKEFRLSQYADDTQLFLDGTEQSLKETLKILNLYYSMILFHVRAKNKHRENKSNLDRFTKSLKYLFVLDDSLTS